MLKELIWKPVCCGDAYLPSEVPSCDRSSDDNVLTGDHELCAPQQCQDVVPARQFHCSIFHKLNVCAIQMGQSSSTFNPHGEVQPQRNNYCQTDERLRNDRSYELVGWAFVRTVYRRFLTKIGSNKSNGIFVTTFPASLNNRMTNWIRLRRYIIIDKQASVAMVAIMANTSIVVVFCVSISDWRFASTRAEYCTQSKIEPTVPMNMTAMSTSQTTMSAPYLNSSRIKMDATVRRKWK